VLTLAIDLGSADALKGRHVEVGRSITVLGGSEVIGEKELLVADSLQIDGETMIEIERSIAMHLTGQIVDVKSIQIDSSDHYLAVVAIDGEHQLVDLGPATTYKVKPTPSTEIVVQRIPIRAQEYRVILASRCVSETKSSKLKPRSVNLVNRTSIVAVENHHRSIVAHYMALRPP